MIITSSLECNLGITCECIRIDFFNRLLLSGHRVGGEHQDHHDRNEHFLHFLFLTVYLHLTTAVTGPPPKIHYPRYRRLTFTARLFGISVRAFVSAPDRRSFCGIPEDGINQIARHASPNTRLGQHIITNKNGVYNNVWNKISTNCVGIMPAMPFRWLKLGLKVPLNEIIT